MAWSYENGEWREISDDEFLDIAETIADRINASKIGIPKPFIEAFETD